VVVASAALQSRAPSTGGHNKHGSQIVRGALVTHRSVYKLSSLLLHLTMEVT